ncbi:MAG: hypothetical protein E6K17_09555 [Methanobacteriota archaeon]|nr:MAG: hypothetical protein E6K17_09555 [Euryarchaeota archaeon]
MELPRVKSRIDGFDDVLGGGIPRGSVVLVTGLPGTMKSSLGWSILLNNAKDDGAKCLYVSLEQTKPSLENQMAAMGFDMEVARRSIHSLDVGTIQKELGRSATKPWMDFLRRTSSQSSRTAGPSCSTSSSGSGTSGPRRSSSRRPPRSPCSPP